ncbi:HNH endonuclease family protein [Streptomyces sp. NBC_00237]|uniref:HNH endonuclease family protein n=1 Tax=Streptomyces sp. NBC_00237 TaxID=2975687 RepID=UPI002256212C|nr:HNH endonuclease family protein [Streptomyces sp. NBC_00237]MCX5207683.1 HNH endonuclease family protein [Streptomyces sp. NBC_00237]
MISERDAMRVHTMGTLAATTAVLAALLTPGAHAAAEPAAQAANPHGAPGDILTMPVQDLLKALPVAAEDRTGYTRSAFRHWIDADKNGCNTRAEVLLQEAFLPPQMGAKCQLTGGEWYSSYDNAYIGDARKLDVDHLVPLAEAFDSGASAWTAAERQAYANDLDDPRALIAVSATTNRAKGDKDPAHWMPPAESTHCEYFRHWVAVKLRWGLSVDADEAHALAQTGATCSNPPVRVTLAR